MSFLGMRHLPASCSKSTFLRTPLSPMSRTARHRVFSSNIISRDISTSTPSSARTLARITPKRIAVRVPQGARPEGGIPQASILSPILFCLLFGGGGFVLAAKLTNDDTRKWIDRTTAGIWMRVGIGRPNDADLWQAKRKEAHKEAQETATKLRETLFFLPDAIYTPVSRLWKMGTEYKLNTPATVVVPMQVVGGMGLVFLAWQFRRFQPFMRKWFLHHPVSFGSTRARLRENITLFTSVISHQSLPHFVFNSIALTSFGSTTYLFLASAPPGDTRPSLPSSTFAYHFLAFLLAGGLFSSLSSHLYTNLVRLPRLIKLLNNPARLSSAQALAAHEAILPGLGASGAVYAALTLTACAFPSTSIGIIFVPFISMPIGLGVAGMVTLDLVGLFRGWRMFDHVAHLGGAFFGVVYYQYGRQCWVWLRRQLGAPERRTA